MGLLGGMHLLPGLPGRAWRGLHQLLRDAESEAATDASTYPEAKPTLGLFGLRCGTGHASNQMTSRHVQYALAISLGSLLFSAMPARAEPITIFDDAEGSNVAASVFGNATGFVALSVGGNTSGGHAIAPVGNASGSAVSVSLLGDSNGGLGTVTIFGDANNSADQGGFSSSVSVFGDAYGALPFSGTGNCNGGACRDIETTGDASSNSTAVSLLGSSDAPIAVAGTGASNGSTIAGSGTGAADGSIAVSGTGPANGINAAVSGNDASARMLAVGGQRATCPEAFLDLCAAVGLQGATGGVAISVFGDAEGRIAGVSLFGNSTGGLSVSGTGHSEHADGHTTTLVLSACDTATAQGTTALCQPWPGP